MYIYLDGLDEVDLIRESKRDYMTQDRLSFLEQLQDNVEDIACHVLIVSRDEPDIRGILGAGSRYRTTAIFYEHSVFRSDVESDVLALSRSLIDEALTNKTQDDKSKLAERLTAKAQGMFLWVDLQGRQLRGGKSKKRLMQTVEAMPKGLESVYRKNWENLLSQPSEEQSRGLNILRWALFAARPLTVPEITEALIIPNDDDEDFLLDELPDQIDHSYLRDELINLCASFIEIRALSPEDEMGSWVVHLKHFSIRQFLLTENAYEMLSDSPLSLSSDPGFRNNDLAMYCLRYLQHELVLENGTESPRLKAFYKYAAEYWHKHVSPAGKAYDVLLRSINEFFDPGNKFWRSWSLYYDAFLKDRFRSLPQVESIPNPLYHAVLLNLSDSLIKDLYKTHQRLLTQVGGVFGTPLEAACFMGNETTVSLLLELGADVNVAGGVFGSALCVAACCGHLAICQSFSMQMPMLAVLTVEEKLLSISHRMKGTSRS